MSWKIVVTTPSAVEVGQSALDRLRNNGCEVVIPSRLGPLPAEAIRAAMDGCDAVLACLDDYSAAVLESSEAASLKIISRWGVGYDRVDVAAANRLGIVVGFTPGLLDNAVADYTWAMLMSLARGVHHGHTSMIGGKWQPDWGTDIGGKTLGIIGTGRIGQVVAKRATGFDMTVLGYDLYPSPAAEALGVHYVSLQELLERSDFVSLNCALTPETRGIIDAKRIGTMKPTALLINTARGALVDESALVAALNGGTIGGAALDAYTEEPLPPDHPLRTCPNLLLTPHQAPKASDTGAKVSDAAVTNIMELMHGRRPPLIVNPEVLDSSTLRASLC